MSKKEITATVRRGKVEFHFDGFEGESHSEALNLLRALYEKMGVKTNDDPESGNRRRGEKEPERTTVKSSRLKAR